jgi:hypothetical protein
MSEGKSGVSSIIAFSIVRSSGKYRAYSNSCLLFVQMKEFKDGREVGYDEVWQCKEKETNYN